LIKAESAEANRKKIRFAEVWKGIKRIKVGPFLALVILCIALSMLSPAFRTWDNAQNILLQTSIIAIIAIGQTFVIMTGGIDLSVGSIVGLVGVLTAGMMSTDPSVGGLGMDPWLASLFGISVGAFIGYMNGLAIAKGGMPPFIVTLGTMGIARGLAYVYTQGMTISNLPDSFTSIAVSKFLGVSMLVWIMIVIFILSWLLLTKTRFGIYVLSTGGNETATLMSGVRVDRVKIAVYTLCGLLSGIAGVLLTSRLQSGIGTNGSGYELDAIAGAVIGGTSLTGGVGTVGGTLVGVLIMSCVRSGLTLLNINLFWHQVVIGLIIIVAVYLDVMRRKYANHRKTKHD